MLKPLGASLLALTLAACGSAAAPATPQTGGSAAAVSAKPASAGAPASPASSAPANAASGQLRQIKIGTPVLGSAFSYLYAARDLGLFKAHGLDPQIIAMPPANAIAALQSGDLDYAATVGSVIRSAAKGIPQRVVQIASNRPNFVIIGAKNTTSLDQLKGKVVAVDAPGSTSFVMLTELMKRKGLQGQYQTVAANSDETRTLFVENGQAAGAIVDVSNGVRLQQQGYPILAQVAEFPEAPFSGLGASQTALQKNRELLKAGLQASLEGVDAMRSRKADVVPVMAKTLNLSEEQEGQVYDQMKNSWTTDGKPSQASTEFELTNDQKTLELKDPITPEQVYDFSLLDELGKK